MLTSVALLPPWVSARRKPHRSFPPAPSLPRSCCIIFHNGRLLRRLKAFIQVLSGLAGEDGRSFGTGAGAGVWGGDAYTLS